ncbi:MAG TPA: ATP-binding protein [Beijerinckiaceae bacterium]|nr:ATP-binding protein [Beijerinckiaceae bacterium]
MARTQAANARSRIATSSGLATTVAEPGYHRLISAEIWAQRIVPVLIAVFLAVVGTSAFFQMTGSRDESLADHKNDLDMIATLVSSRLREVLQPSAERSSEEAFRLLLPTATFSYGRRVYIVDGHGAILHGSSAGQRPAAYIDDVIQGSQPLLSFGDRAGVLLVKETNRGEALATARRIPATQQGASHVIVVQSVSDALTNWRGRTKAFVTLFLTLGGVVAALGAAFYVQAARARQADRICNRMTVRIDSALAEARCGLWEWDLSLGRFFWSDSMYQLIGLARGSDLISLAEIQALSHPDDSSLFALADRMLASNGQTAEYEFRMRHSAGHWVWLRARLQLIRDSEASHPRLIGVVIDVTEQKQFEEMTRRADVRLSDAINSISEAFVLWDHDNRLVLCNAKFRQLHALAPETVVPGARYEDVIPHTSLEMETGSTGERGDRSLSRVYEAQMPDGRWLQVSERRTMDGGFVSVGTDITTHKDQEARLMDSERRLLATVADLRKSRQALQIKTVELAELADRYKEKTIAAEAASNAKTAFLANMSHELRTPLNAIIGFSEMMEHKIYGDLGSRHYEEYAGLIRRSGSNLLTIINDILEMARIEAGNVAIDVSELPVTPLVQSVADLVAEEAAAKRIDLKLDLRADLWVRADARAVRQALAHLLHNAIKFTPDGGRAAIRVRRAMTGVNIFIEDTGVGISPENLARFGRPFDVMEGKLINGCKGSGLGVAIARSLVELHGGGIRVRSWVNSGTIVLVHLPIAPPPGTRDPDSLAA